MKAKKISIIVKIVAVVFGLGLFIASLFLLQRLPTLDEALAIVAVMFSLEGMVLSIDISIIAKNIKEIKEAVK